MLAVMTSGELREALWQRLHGLDWWASFISRTGHYAVQFLGISQYDFYMA